ncbi:hypothetical protein TWF694_004714 [Orbilia ellipsospora]|uniref:Uncharacterized protein n=1 Tax=Orbilia ellipsospora TaxID=2528407 RepID=A0AAV9WW22_9PEZI
MHLCLPHLAVLTAVFQIPTAQALSYAFIYLVTPYEQWTIDGGATQSTDRPQQCTRIPSLYGAPDASRIYSPLAGMVIRQDQASRPAQFVAFWSRWKCDWLPDIVIRWYPQPGTDQLVDFRQLQAWTASIHTESQMKQWLEDRYILSWAELDPIRVPDEFAQMAPGAMAVRSGKLPPHRKLKQQGDSTNYFIYNDAVKVRPNPYGPQLAADYSLLGTTRPRSTLIPMNSTSEYIARRAGDAPWARSFAYPNGLAPMVPQNRPANVQAPVNQVQAPVDQSQDPVNQVQAPVNQIQAPAHQAGVMEEEELLIPPEQDMIEIQGEKFNIGPMGDILLEFENGGDQAVVAQQEAIWKQIQAQRAQNNAPQNQVNPPPVQQQPQPQQSSSQRQGNPQQRPPQQSGFQPYLRPGFRPAPPTGPRPGSQGGSQPGPQGGSQPIRQVGFQPGSQGNFPPQGQGQFPPKGQRSFPSKPQTGSLAPRQRTYTHAPGIIPIPNNQAGPQWYFRDPSPPHSMLLHTPLTTERLQQDLGSVGLTPRQVLEVIYDRGPGFAIRFVRDRFAVPRLRYEVQNLSPERFELIRNEGRFENSHPSHIADVLTALRVSGIAMKAKVEHREEVFNDGMKPRNLERNKVLSLIIEIVARMTREGIKVTQDGQRGPTSPIPPFIEEPQPQPQSQPQPGPQPMQEEDRDSIPVAQPLNEDQMVAEVPPDELSEFATSLIANEEIPVQQANINVSANNNAQVQGEMEEELEVTDFNPASGGLQVEVEEAAINPAAGDMEEKASVSNSGDDSEILDIRVLEEIERLPSHEILENPNIIEEALDQAANPTEDQINAAPTNENQYVSQLDQAELNDVIRGFVNFVAEWRGEAPLEEHAPDEEPDLQVVDPVVAPAPAQRNSRQLASEFNLQLNSEPGRQPVRTRLKKFGDVIRESQDKIQNINAQLPQSVQDNPGIVPELERQPVRNPNIPPGIEVVQRTREDVMAGAQRQIDRILNSYHNRRDAWDARSIGASSLNPQRSQRESDSFVGQEAAVEISAGAQDLSELERVAGLNRLGMGLDASDIHSYFTPEGSPPRRGSGVEIENIGEEDIEDYNADKYRNIESNVWNGGGVPEGESPSVGSKGSDWDSDNPDSLNFYSKGKQKMSEEEREAKNAARREANRQAREEERRQREYLSNRNRIQRPAANTAREISRQIANGYRGNFKGKRGANQ